MITSHLYFVTDFGDSAVTGTVATVTAGYMLYLKHKRAAFAIITAFCAAALLIALGKLALYSQCQHPNVPFDLRSPSGHSAISIAVYGTLTTIIASSLSGWRKIAFYLGAAVFVVSIATSRVLLGSHTVSDVVVGSAVGVLVYLAVWRIFLRGAYIKCRWLRFSLIALVSVIFLHGMHFPAEGIIHHFSHLIRKRIAKCG